MKITQRKVSTTIKKNYSTLNENDGIDLRKPYIIDVEIDRVLQSSDIFYITEEMVNEILEKNDPNFIRNIINYFYNKMSIKDQNRLFEKVLYNDKRFKDCRDCHIDYVHFFIM